jgi:hypothetical protein
MGREGVEEDHGGDETEIIGKDGLKKGALERNGPLFLSFRGANEKPPDQRPLDKDKGKEDRQSHHDD